MYSRHPSSPPVGHTKITKPTHVSTHSVRPTTTGPACDKPQFQKDKSDPCTIASVPVALATKINLPLARTPTPVTPQKWLARSKAATNSGSRNYMQALLEINRRGNEPPWGTGRIGVGTHRNTSPSPNRLYKAPAKAD